MTASFTSASEPLDRSDPVALLAAIRHELEAVDLDGPLPPAVVAGTAIARSNGDGHEIDPLGTRLLVLAARGTLSYDECVMLTNHVSIR